MGWPQNCPQEGKTRGIIVSFVLPNKGPGLCYLVSSFHAKISLFFCTLVFPWLLTKEASVGGSETLAPPNLHPLSKPDWCNWERFGPLMLGPLPPCLPPKLVTKLVVWQLLAILQPFFTECPSATQQALEEKKQWKHDFTLKLLINQKDSCTNCSLDVSAGTKEDHTWSWEFPDSLFQTSLFANFRQRH